MVKLTPPCTRRRYCGERDYRILIPEFIRPVLKVSGFFYPTRSGFFLPTNVGFFCPTLTISCCAIKPTPDLPVSMPDVTLPYDMANHLFSGLPTHIMRSSFAGSASAISKGGRYPGYLGNCPNSCGTYFSMTAHSSVDAAKEMQVAMQATSSVGPDSQV